MGYCNGRANAKTKIILVRVKKRTAKTIKKVMKKYIKKESIIFSDEWRGYIMCKDIFQAHLTVNHSKHYVDPVTSAHTQTIEGNWSAIKQSIPKKTQKQKGNFILSSKIHVHEKS